MGFIGGLFNNLGITQPDAPSTSSQLSKLFPLLLKYYPQIMSEVNANVGPQAQAQLDAARATSGPMSQLMTDLYRQYGPQLAQIGSDIGLQTQRNQAGNNATVANSAEGQAALKANIDADRAANPQFYATRELESQRLADLMNSVDLTGKLSGSETRAIDQSLAQQNNRTGTVNIPSATQTTSNAMTYGNETYKRQEQAKSDLSNALGQASGFLPVSKSSVDAWTTATGGPTTSTGTANASQGFFSGPTDNSQATQTGAGLFGSLSGGGMNLSGNTTSTNANKDSPWQSLVGSL